MLSNEKLQELLDDEDKVLLHLRCLPDVEQLTRNQEHYIEVNEQLASMDFFLLMEKLNTCTQQDISFSV